MNKFYLVKFKCDWSDEFDVTGVSVCDSVRYDHEKQTVEQNPEYELRELYFGTNEFLDEMTLSELYECFTFIEISETTYLELQPAFISMYQEGFGTWFRWPSSVYNETTE